MTHEEAVSQSAAERYLLDGLAAAERADFEEHFFQCPECGEAVRAGAVFVANARGVFREQAPAPERVAARQGWTLRGLLGMKPAWACVAALALVLLVGYEEMIRVPRLKREASLAGTAQAYPAFVLRTATRGEGQTLTVPSWARFIGLSIDLPPGPAYTGYDSRLESADGRTRLTVPAAAPAGPIPEINLLVPASIPPGKYGLTLFGNQPGSPPEEIGRYEFTIRFK